MVCHQVCSLVYAQCNTCKWKSVKVSLYNERKLKNKNKQTNKQTNKKRGKPGNEATIRDLTPSCVNKVASENT